MTVRPLVRSRSVQHYFQREGKILSPWCTVLEKNINKIFWKKVLFLDAFYIGPRRSLKTSFKKVRQFQPLLAQQRHVQKGAIVF